MRPRWFHESRSERVLAKHYPFGIARRALLGRAVKLAVDHKPGPVLFIASFSDDSNAGIISSFIGPQGELLAKAVTQGLKWSLESARLAFAFSSLKSAIAILSQEDQAAARSAIHGLISTLSPRAIVALGHQAAQTLDVSLPTNQVPRSLTPQATILVSGTEIPVIYSRDLREVIADPECKKLFWQDLKFLSGKVRE